MFFNNKTIIKITKEKTGPKNDIFRTFFELFKNFFLNFLDTNFGHQFWTPIFGHQFKIQFNIQLIIQ
jgi:hypothetical protein